MGWAQTSPNHHRRTRLQILATKQGQTVEEYLVEHPEYRMSGREKRQYDGKVLTLAGKLINDIQHPD